MTTLYSSQNLLEFYSKQFRRIVLLSGVYLNGHSLVFRPQTQALEPTCKA